MTDAAAVMRMLLGIVFLVSALGKAREVDRFTDTVQRVLRIVGARARHPVARGAALAVVAAEASAAILMLTGRAPSLAGFVVLGLLALFAAVSVVALVARANIDCNCFGPSGGRLGARTLARTLLLAAVAVAYVFTASRGHNGWPAASLASWVALATATGGFALVIHWVTYLDIPVWLVRERRREEAAQRSDGDAGRTKGGANGATVLE